MTTETRQPRPANDMADACSRAMRSSDSVELKLTVPDGDHRATIATLPPRSRRGPAAPGVLLRHAGSRLNQAGSSSGHAASRAARGDTVVKLRPVVPAELPPELRQLTALQRRGRRAAGRPCVLRVAQGASPAAMTSAMRRRRDVRSGSCSPRNSAPSTRSTRRRASTRLSLGARADVRAQGHVHPAELGRRIVAEIWLYPDGARILELSTKCLPNEAFEVAAARAPTSRTSGVPLDGIQQTKTKIRPWSFFGAELRAEATGRVHERRVRRGNQDRHHATPPDDDGRDDTPDDDAKGDDGEALRAPRRVRRR